MGSSRLGEIRICILGSCYVGLDLHAWPDILQIRYAQHPKESEVYASGDFVDLGGIRGNDLSWPVHQGQNQSLLFGFVNSKDSTIPRAPKHRVNNTDNPIPVVKKATPISYGPTSRGPTFALLTEEPSKALEGPARLMVQPLTHINVSSPLTDEQADSGHATPYLQFTPKRAMPSFENLVALANYQERLKEARKMVWRDKGQPVVVLEDLRACLRHAVNGGFRSATLAFNIRACINIVLALLRMRKLPKELRLSLIYRAIFGSDTFRFAGMLGTFTAVYKFLINALPLIIPAMKPSLEKYQLSAFEDEADDIDLESGRRRRHATPGIGATVVEVPLAERRARLSLSAHARMALVRKRTRRWHAALAGSVAGALAIIWESRNRRGFIAQQMFVRGLQGSYNAFSHKHNIHIPHGAVLVFSLACGQILYAFLLRPDTLPKSYSAWLYQAAKVPAEAVHMNKGLVREGKFDLADLDSLLDRTEITSSNLTKLRELRNMATSSIPSYGPRYAPCASTHPAIDSCLYVPIDRFFDVFKWMLPIYGALHFIPAILFKWKQFLKEPGKMLLRSSWGTTRSSAFLGVFVIIYQTVFCMKHNLHTYLTTRSPLGIKLPRSTVDLLISKGSFWIPGFLCGLSLFIEAPRRRGELAMYVLPKGLESAWVMARGKGLVFRTGNYGDIILTAIGMGMVMSTYQNDPQHLSGLVRRIMYQFIGPN